MSLDVVLNEEGRGPDGWLDDDGQATYYMNPNNEFLIHSMPACLFIS